MEFSVLDIDGRHFQVGNRDAFGIVRISPE
jgi:hypothetical protein